MSTFDIEDLDDANESQWRAFTTELADRVADFEPGCELSIRPAYLPEGVADRAMLVRSTTTGTLVCAAFGLVDPDRPWRRSDESSIHVVEEDASWVDRFAATLVAAIRASWNLPHPSFLRGWEPIAPADRSTAITETVDESVFVESVGEALTARFGGGVEFSDAGFLVTAGPTTTVVNVLGVDEVRVHACVVERISGRTRAAELVADLNRRHPRMKFVLVEDRVHVAVSVDALPFVSEHLFHAIERVTAFASTVDHPFADNFGGVVAQESVLTVQEVASESGEEVPSPVMTLLEIDAEFGSLSATDVLAVCGPDREIIADYEAYCADQARSWRDYAQEAYDGGDMDVARNSEREAIPWDRVVVALRTALGTVGFFDNA